MIPRRPKLTREGPAVEVGFPSAARSRSNCLLLYVLKSNVGEGGSQVLSFPGAASPNSVMSRLATSLGRPERLF